MFLMIEHLVGWMKFLSVLDPTTMKNNIPGHADTAMPFDILDIMGTSWPQGRN